MSPSEFDLRSALRDGEGDDGLDVDSVVAEARGRRSRRRTRILSSAAAVVVVAAAAVGGTVVLGGNDGSGRNNANSGGSSADTRASSAAGAQALPAQPAPTDQGKPAVLTCPATFPRTLLPGGGSPGRFGSSGPLFSAPVATIVVCGYGASTTSATAPSPLLLTGSDATTLAASLEHAATTRRAKVCPDIVSADTMNFAFTARTAAGTALKTVTTSLTLPACNQLVTNGTAVRYGWSPPAALRARLLALVPGGVPASTGTGATSPGTTGASNTPGTENGSPAH